MGVGGGWEVSVARHRLRVTRHVSHVTFYHFLDVLVVRAYGMHSNADDIGASHEQC